MSEEQRGGQAERKINTLGLARSFKLSQWLAANRDRLQEHGTPYDEAAAQAAKDTGFAVTGHNLRGVAKAAGLEWAAKRKNAGFSGSSNLWAALHKAEAKLDEAAKLIEQLLLDNQKLHKDVSDLQAQAAQLRGSVATLAKMTRSGYTPPFAAINDANKTPVVGR